MNILESLGAMLGGGDAAGAGRGAAGAGAGGGLGGLGGLLTSGAMGDIARNVLTNKKGDFSWLKGALLAGAGTMLWKKLTDRVGEENAAVPQYGKVASTPDEQAERVIRAIVYAAKSDGHIDDREKAAINSQVGAMNLGKAAEQMVKQAMSEPLDPNNIARGLRDPREALQLYTLSRAVIDPDQFMEKNYLDALAQALGIPEDVRDQVEQQVMAGAR